MIQLSNQDKKFQTLSFNSPQTPCARCEQTFKRSELSKYKGKSYCVTCFPIIKTEEAEKKEAEQPEALPTEIPADFLGEFVRLQNMIIGFQDELSDLRNQVTLLSTPISKSNVLLSPADLEAKFQEQYGIPSNLTYDEMNTYANKHKEVPATVGYFLIRMKKEYKVLESYFNLLKSLN